MATEEIVEPTTPANVDTQHDTPEAHEAEEHEKQMQLGKAACEAFMEANGASADVSANAWAHTTNRKAWIAAAMAARNVALILLIMFLFGVAQAHAIPVASCPRNDANGCGIFEGGSFTETLGNAYRAAIAFLSQFC